MKKTVTALARQAAHRPNREHRISILMLYICAALVITPLPAPFVARSAESGDNVLSYELRPLFPTMTASNAKLIFTLLNSGNAPVRVLKWQTPLEPLSANILSVKCNGEDLGYEGPLIKRQRPKDGDYAAIEPGGSLSSTIALSDTYPLPDVGKCVVTYSGELMSILFQSGDATTADFNPMKINGTTAAFELAR